MENTRKPQILIQTDGIQNTKVFVDGKELTGVAGIRFSQSYKENKGLPVLQIDLKATNVTLDAKYSLHCRNHIMDNTYRLAN